VENVEPCSVRRRRKGVTFAEIEADHPKPDLALALLGYLINHPINRAILLRKNQTQLKELRNHLISKERLSYMVEKLDCVDPKESTQVILLLR